MENIEDLQLLYGFGNCAEFAVALSKKYSLPIVEFYAGKEIYHVAVVIAGKDIKSDRFIDVFGINSYKEIKTRYGMPGKQSIEVKDENELKVMSLFTDEDVNQAEKAIEYLLENNLVRKKLKQ